MEVEQLVPSVLRYVVSSSPRHFRDPAEPVYKEAIQYSWQQVFVNKELWFSMVVLLL